eukprot:gene26218-5975_t
MPSATRRRAAAGAAIAGVTALVLTVGAAMGLAAAAAAAAACAVDAVDTGPLSEGGDVRRLDVVLGREGGRAWAWAVVVVDWAMPVVLFIAGARAAAPAAAAAAAWQLATAVELAFRPGVLLGMGADGAAARDRWPACAEPPCALGARSLVGDGVVTILGVLAADFVLCELRVAVTLCVDAAERVTTQLSLYRTA